MALLSICIPTYNRAEILKKSLESLVTQEVFLKTDDVEIVISDNCSTDHTKAVSLDFVGKFGNKIKYFCNETNVRDANFSRAARRGTGTFLKICNDTLLYCPDTLSYMLGVVKKYEQSKPVLFFKNNADMVDILEVKTFDDFVKTVSFFSTWIGGFGLWKSEAEVFLPLMDEFATTKLPQTATLFEMIYQKQYAVVVGHRFCDLIVPSLKGGYNLSEVFIQNYLAFYEKYLQNGTLSYKIYEEEKWLVLKKHVLPRQFNLKCKFSYDKSNFWKYTRPYRYNLRFYILLLLILIKKVKYTLKMLYRR